MADEKKRVKRRDKKNISNHTILWHITYLHYPHIKYN